jgi:hypothetical protein
MLRWNACQARCADVIVTADVRRRGHSPIHKSACDASVPSHGHDARRVAAIARRPRKSADFLSRGWSFSWAFVEQLRLISGIIVYGPYIREKPITRLEILPAALKAPDHVGLRNIVTALPHAASNASQRQVGRGQAQVDLVMSAFRLRASGLSRHYDPKER